MGAGKEGRGRVTPSPPGLRRVGEFPAEAPITSLLVPSLLCQWRYDGVPSSGLLEMGLPCGDTWVSHVCHLALGEATCLLLEAT